MQQLTQRSGFATNSTDIFNTHRDEPHNNSSTPFEISAVSCHTACNVHVLLTSPC